MAHVRRDAEAATRASRYYLVVGLAALPVARKHLALLVAGSARHRRVRGLKEAQRDHHQEHYRLDDV